MSSRRVKKFLSAIDGLSAVVQNSINPGTGWPGSFAVSIGESSQLIALHVSGISSHARKPHEVRFQNPGQTSRPAVSDLNGAALPILLGIDEGLTSTIFVAVNGHSRLGSTKRFSILFDRAIINKAQHSGLSVYRSSNEERIYAFKPQLLPAIITHFSSGEMLTDDELFDVVNLAGALEQQPDKQEEVSVVERTSRMIRVLSRKSRAGLKIREAYGYMCSMCGIGSNLLAGAHIYPVEANGSCDDVWNGLSLCHNHHAAFDLHLIWVHPTLRTIHIHPKIREEALSNEGTSCFVNSTFSTLASPSNSADSPRTAMFENRHNFFIEHYEWISQ